MSEEYKKGLWTVEEDMILTEYVVVHGKGKWNRISLATGLKRCGKSCRLRWVNYLSPDVKRGDFSLEEDDLIIRLHNLLGNRWSLIAGRVPGRTDNQVKNHWNTRLSKKRGFNEPICRENARSVITTTSRHLPKVKRPKARLTADSDPEKRASEDDVSSRCARPTSQRGAITEDDRPSTFVRFSDVKLNLLSEQLVRKEHMGSTQPPLIAMPEAAEAIQRPKPATQKELTDDQLMIHSSEASEELQKAIKFS